MLSYLIFSVGSYLLLNTIFHWLCSVVHPIVSCAIVVHSIVLLTNPEACSMRYDTTRFLGSFE